MAEEARQGKPELQPVQLQGVAPGRESAKVVPIGPKGVMSWSDWAEREFIASGVLAGTLTTMFTCRREVRDCLLRVTLADTSQRTFRICLVPSGGTAGDDNQLFSTGTILPVGHPGYDMRGFGMRTGMFLSGIGSTASKVSWLLLGVLK